MKNTKRARRAAAFAAAVVMAACAAVPMGSSFSASAEATENTISFTGQNGNSTHTYQAYMIFSGTAVENGFGSSAELQGIQWANSTGAAAFLQALKGDTTIGSDFKDCTTAAAVADVLKGYSANSEKAKAFADLAIANKTNLKAVGDAGSNITATEDGYYVIEETGVTAGTSTMTAHLLGVYDASAGAEIKVKSSLPTFEKKIMDSNDSGTTVQDGSKNDTWQDSADHDFGDKVPFQLTGTLPDDYASYKQYKMVFHDNLQDGVYGSPENVKVYYKHGTDNAVEITATNYTISNPGTADDGFVDTHGDKTCNLEINIANLKTATGDVTLQAGDKIIVEYQAELLTAANMGEAGNWNSGYLEYSNNPYHTGEGDTTSKTPEDMVVDFTYQLAVDKVDNADKPLEGAGFTLYKYNGTDYEAVGTEITGVTTFEFKGVDAGKYKLVETTVPKGFNKAEDLIFVVKAEHDETADAPTLKTLTVVSENGDSLTSTDSAAGKFIVTKNVGLAATKIINNSGSSLPSTGGIGTTMFYVGGGVLVAGAGVLLITKKRAKKDAE